MVLPLYGRFFTFDHQRSIKELGIEYIDAKKSLIEMAYKMIDMGMIPDKRKNKKK